jgi:hypothetical protein
MQTLERLHAELGGQILENREEAQRLAGQMLHVEAVIKMLDPTYNLRRISVKRRTPNPRFKRGTIYRRAMDVLRTATEPMTAREVAERALAAAGIAKPNKAALAGLTGSILSSLRNHKGKGIQRTNEGSPAKWLLAQKE